MTLVVGPSIDEIKALSQPEANLLAAGHCPKCERKVRGFKPMFGAFAPEWWATMRERGLDPATGHKEGCAWSNAKF